MATPLDVLERERAQQAAGASLLVFGGSLAILGVAFLVNPNVALGFALVVLTAVLCFTRPAVAIPLVVAFAGLSSGLRRMTTYYIEDPGALDPLLAVVPAAAVALTIVAIRRGANRRRTPLATAILTLLVIAFLGIANPLQGHAGIGVVGFAFFGVPLLWFWVGRELVTDAVMAASLRMVALLAVVFSGYGIAQANGWTSGWDQLWLDTTDIPSLTVGGETKPFAFLTTAGEYARYLSMGIVIWVARGRWISPDGPSRIVSLSVIGLLGTGLIYGSVRGTVIMTALALGAVYASRRGMQLAAAVTMAVLSFGGLVLAANVAQSSGFSGSTLFERQIDGLADPFGGDASTFDKRANLFQEAVSSAISDPIGQGTGITTPAVRQFGGRPLNSESDVGDVALSWGMPGLLVYVVVLVLALLYAYRLARARGDWLALGVMGVLFAAATQWINGGLYAIAPVVWLSIGWIERSWRDVTRGPDGPQPFG